MPKRTAISAASAPPVRSARNRGADGRHSHTAAPATTAPNQSPVVGCTTIARPTRAQASHARRLTRNAEREKADAEGHRARLNVAFERVRARLRDAMAQRHERESRRRCPPVRAEPPREHRDAGEGHDERRAVPDSGERRVAQRHERPDDRCNVVAKPPAHLRVEHEAVPRKERRVDRARHGGNVERLIGHAVAVARRSWLSRRRRSATRREDEPRAMLHRRSSAVGP